MTPPPLLDNVTKYDYGLSKEQCLTVTPYPYSQWRLAFGPSCTEFVYLGCWHFDNGATIKIDDVQIQHGGLAHVLHLCTWDFILGGQVEGTILRCSYSLSFVVGPLLHA